MGIEHRYSKRVEVGFEVALGYRKRWFPVTTARDLGPDGMFVHTDGIKLPGGTLVELAFHRHGRDWRIPAVVVHLAEKGVGVMFRHSEPALYAAELEVLHPGRPHPGHAFQAELRAGS